MDDHNDLAPSIAGHALGPPGKTEEPHPPEALPEKNRHLKAVSSPDGYPGPVFNPGDVAGADGKPNVIDPGVETNLDNDSQVSENPVVAGANGTPNVVGPVAETNLDSDSQESENPVVAGANGTPNVVGPVAETNLDSDSLESENPVVAGANGTPNVIGPVAETNLDSDSLESENPVVAGANGTPNDVGPVAETNLDSDSLESENRVVGFGTEDNTDEELWCKAIEEWDCGGLRNLLAKDVSYFWKYEKKNSKTALHAAAKKGDLILAELILDMLSWAEMTQDPEFSFLNSGLRIDKYIEAKTSGKTAEEVAKEKNQAGVRNKILDYIANDRQRRTYKERSMADSGPSENQHVRRENLEWNEAMKKKDCQALLKLLRDEGGEPNSGERLLKLDVLKGKSYLKYGKGERRTMLHVAAMQGCFPLAKLILDMLRSLLIWPKQHYIQAVDDLSGLTAFEMANDIIGNRSISEYLQLQIFDISEYGSIKHKLQVKTENDDYRIATELNGGLISFEAYPDTRWYMALERGHTIELKKLLEFNSRFVLETGHGMTVLHVAILWDDLELVKTVLKLCEPNTKRINWGNLYYPSSLDLEVMIRQHRNIDHRYLNKYWDRSWKPIEPTDLKKLQRGGNTCILLASLLKRVEIVEEFNSKFTTVNSTSIVDDEYSTMPLRLQIFFKETWEKSPQWIEEEFQKDVEFNFEDSKRQGWLRFHYACKDPMKFKDLLQELARFITRHPYDGVKLFQTWDAKGRTPFHILMDHYNDQHDPGWPFDEIFNHERFKDWIQIAENARGTRIIDMVLTKNYLQRNIILQPWKYFKLDLQHENFERSEITTLLCYQVAYLLKQKSIAEEIWSSFLEEKDMKNILKENQDEFKSMLLIAASTGNQACLQLLLDTYDDPMITDTQGRSLLHHAADPTLLFPQLVEKCPMTTVEELCDFKKKWSEGNTSYSPQDVSSSGLTNTQDVIVAERSNVGRKGCILMLLQAGVDLGQSDKDNKVPSIGPTIDATYQSWWYDTVVKDSTDKRNGYSQAGNALSVVGTLVAATSYIGPLQPPLSYDTSISGSTGFVKTTEPLIKAFMVSTSVAFYFAMASVMFAVVSSLPMPQEGVMGELKRAKRVVSFSLCLLLIAIVSIIVSFATASIVAIQNEHSFHSTDLLFVPSIIGWFFCFLGIGGFFIRVARLIFYKDPTIRRFYQFSYGRGTFKCLWVIVLCLCILVSSTFLALVVIVDKISDVAYFRWNIPGSYHIWNWSFNMRGTVDSFCDDLIVKLKLELRHLKLVCGR